MIRLRAEHKLLRKKLAVDGGAAATEGESREDQETALGGHASSSASLGPSSSSQGAGLRRQPLRVSLGHEREAQVGGASSSSAPARPAPTAPPPGLELQGAGTGSSMGKATS